MRVYNRCPHGKRKHECKDCTPWYHGKLKRLYAYCNACPHGKVKQSCAECTP